MTLIYKQEEESAASVSKRPWQKTEMSACSPIQVLLIAYELEVQWLLLETPSIMESVLGLVSLVSEYWDQWWSAVVIFVWQQMNFSKQAQPRDTDCCWDIQQPKNKNKTSYKQKTNGQTNKQKRNYTHML